MASDETREPGCRERVALDLAKEIASREDKPTNPRDHWLELYHQCYNAVVLGWDAEAAKRGE